VIVLFLSVIILLAAAILLSLRGTSNLFMFELIGKIFSEEERKDRR
jgi:hypothetical protein